MTLCKQLLFLLVRRYRALSWSHESSHRLSQMYHVALIIELPVYVLHEIDQVGQEHRIHLYAAKLSGAVT
jgi:hypothetical protein